MGQGVHSQKDPSWVPTFPTVLAASSPEAFPDGTEVFGGLDGEDDTGDQEEGTPREAEPEGILGWRM